MRRALVTGDLGFLGRHFREELHRSGYYVVGLDTKRTTAQDCRAYFQRELRQPASRRDSYDLVVHCAAVVGGRETIERDPLATAESLSIDAEMFRWAAVARPGRVLYFSSSAAYPITYQTRNGVPLREDDVWNGDRGILGPEPGTYWDVSEPDEVYGWSKVTGELLADRLRRAGVPVTVVRPFSGYGADQDETYPFRALLERVRRREDPFTVWSDATRDWIHVDDVVAGALALVDEDVTDPVNLCTGVGTRFTDLARLMARTAGYAPEIRVLDDKPKGVAYRVGDPTRLHRYYRPCISIEQGVRRALLDE